MSRPSSIVANAAGAIRDRLARLMPWAYGLSNKHDYGRDYGWPEHLGFEQFYRLYCRAGLPAAAVDKTIGKTWATMPALWESEKPAESPKEEEIREHFEETNIWRSLMEADRRSMVGEYAGAIIILRDGKKLAEPVGRVPGGLKGIVGVIPAWQGQLTVVEWDVIEGSDTYGEPMFYQFDEQAVGNPQNAAKSQVRIHRDRVIIFSDDGTLNCKSALQAGYDDASDAMKIKGAGAEGFWKSARGAPIIEAAQGVTPQDMMKGMGLSSAEEVKEKLNEKVDDFQSGFDKALMIGGFTAKPMTITLPQPKEFWEACVLTFAASMQIPFKVLVGNITGERASTEDKNEWAETCMSRRENRVLPILRKFISRLVAWGVLEKGLTIGWTSLLEASPDDKLDRAGKMSTINQQAGTELVFLPDEIREEAGFKSADEVEGFAEWQAERDARAKEAAEDGPTENIPDDEVKP